MTAIGFADDGAILVKGHDLSIMRDLMQDALNIAEKWSKEFGLTFCPNKTVIQIFHNVKIFHEMEPLYLGGQKLHVTNQIKPKKGEQRKKETVKYLGLDIDTKL